MKKFLLFSFIIAAFTLQAQTAAQDTIVNNAATLQFSYKQLIIPSALIAYGFIGIESDQIKSWNRQVRDGVTDIDDKTTIDDFSQWAPAASVFALDAFGVKAKNSFRNRSVVLITSYVIMSASVLSLKSITGIERPDGSSNNSFPSGHTATAFAGAEFLWQEYKDTSVYIGIAGYVVAAGTGAFRVYNNRHWATDVATGAGIGILSTKLAYWLNPYLTKTLFGGKAEKDSSTFIMPVYDGIHAGLCFTKTF